MRRCFAVFALICLSLPAFAADTKAAPAAPASLLPQEFAGWQKASTAKHGDKPEQVDAAYPAVLKEYGFQDYETAEYTRDGRHLTVKAARFDNVSGTFGAFTFYRAPQMQPEKIGDDAASNNTRILFYRSNVLVDVSLDQTTAMSAADLRVLAKELPQAHGNEATPPNLPGYLPKDKLVSGTVRYVLGPDALNLVHAPVSADQVNFAKFGNDAEVALGDYEDRGARSTMVVISYPTKEIATERLHNLDTTMQSAPGYISKRSGDKVVVMTGDLPMADEKGLVGSVNFDATVSWTEATSVSPRNNIGNLIVAVFSLIGILMLVGAGFGFLMGGTRVLFRRILPGRFHKEDEDEFISLDLR
ncbi:MAG TPA: DUF6599 family protein [Candidatus Koribacter sp.]|jgi:hypothetical protein